MKLNWPWSTKKKQVQRRQYAAAQFNRLVADWVAMSTSADAEIRGSLRALRARSRQLGRDNDYVRSAFRGFQNNIIGQGIPFQSQVRKQRGKELDEKINDQIETKWMRWCRARFCDVTGKNAFWEIERLLVRSAAENGDVFVRMITQSFGGSRIPLALEVLEADMLDDDYNDVMSNGNTVRMGVELDAWSRPVAYHFHEKHPGDYQFGSKPRQRTSQRIRIPAGEIIALGLGDRVGQTRCVPWLISAMIRIRHMHGYEEAEVIAARASASLMGFIETENGELPGDAVDGDQRVTEFEPGVFKQMNPGEKVNVPDLSRPGGQFDPFMRAMLRGVAAGVGTSYETLSADFSQSNYSSSRMALLVERDNWRVLQKWIIESFHQVVFEKWLDMAVLAGELALPQYEIAPEKYTEAVKWLPRGWAWVDPLKEVEAYGEAVDRGFMTQTDVISQQGGDIEELMTTREREVKMAQDKGLEFKQDLGTKAVPARSTEDEVENSPAVI